MKVFLLVSFMASLLFSFTSSKEAFSLTPEEMVFVSKLSDENRKKFCYQFSSEERILAMQEELSPDESVEKIQGFVSE